MTWTLSTSLDYFRSAASEFLAAHPAAVVGVEAFARSQGAEFHRGVTALVSPSSTVGGHTIMSDFGCDLRE
ncbi:hypothetical protein [Kitasatospora viridis]|uniref:hypothetical protein n=1 Tax=Kitasatospora viridis TaxID=281105 RepID=UPI0011A2D2A0|nr:hypothetical protein [Kitasatospora viridis]